MFVYVLVNELHDGKRLTLNLDCYFGMRLRSFLFPGTVMYSDSKKAESLAARLVDPVIRKRGNSDSDEDDDDAIFAELEAEIENGDEYARETAIQAIKREYVYV
jgi:hypothetical protein